MYACINDSSMQSERKAFVDLTNISSDDETTGKSFKRTSVQGMFPQQTENENTFAKQLTADRFQNVHPLLPWYKFDENTSCMSYDKFMHLIDPKNDEQMIIFLTDSSDTCLNCGGSMQKVKEGAHWFWLCSKTANGISCNKGK